MNIVRNHLGDVYLAEESIRAEKYISF